MQRREELFGIAEKLLKHDISVKGRPKVTPLPDRRLRGRR
jgi:hypothetical protein